MWSPTFRRKINNCTHEDVTTTDSYGLRRTVCTTCGNVSVEHLSDFLEGLLAEAVKEKENSQV